MQLPIHRSKAFPGLVSGRVLRDNCYASHGQAWSCQKPASRLDGRAVVPLTEDDAKRTLQDRTHVRAGPLAVADGKKVS